MIKRRLVPFKWLPGSWGLKGKTYERAKAEYELAGDDLDLRLAEIEDGKDSASAKKIQLKMKFSKQEINQTEYNKELATLNKEPWVSVINIKVNKENPSVAGEIELDWNDYFVEELKKNGHTGPNDYFIVEQWFNLLCSAIASENGIVPNPTENENNDNSVDLGNGKREYR